MKTWLKENKCCLQTAVMVALAFALGWWAGRIATNRQAYAALWEAIVTLPDPEDCALCGEITRHHALYLIDLSTGEMDKLTVYEADLSRPWEILPMDRQPTGTFNFQPCAGLMGVRDTSLHTFAVTLPEERKLINPAHFCQNCRTLLAGIELEGYVILNHYDLNHVRAYPVHKNSNQVIRDYRVTVDKGKGGTWTLCVTGLQKE